MIDMDALIKRLDKLELILGRHTTLIEKRFEKLSEKG
jgi:hypothetical protein